MSDIETTDVDMFTIGNNLRELREQKRVTQMQVVDVLAVAIHQSICRCTWVDSYEDRA